MRQMTSLQFAESLAFERLEPDPATTTMELLAQLLTVSANAFLKPKKPFTVADFLPSIVPDPTSVAEQKVQAATTMAAFEANYQARKRQRKEEQKPN